MEIVSMEWSAAVLKTTTTQNIWHWIKEWEIDGEENAVIA